MNPKFVEARRSLVQGAIDEIVKVQDFSNFRVTAFCQIAKFGLQMKAKEDKLFSTDSWGNPNCRNELIEKVREFLTRYTKWFS